MQKVSEGNVIFLDAGTTTAAMIPLLNQAGLQLRIVTNSVTHASKLTGEQLTVYVLGGLIKKTTDSVIGGQALSQLSNYRFNLAFIGANAYDEALGAMTPDGEEANIKQLVIQLAEKAYLLADRSKLSKTSFVKFAEADEVELITNNGEEK